MAEASRALDTIFELNKLLDCGLDRETLSICIALIENGVSPEVRALGTAWGSFACAAPWGLRRHGSASLQALADVVARLRQQAAATSQQPARGGGSGGGGRQ